MRYEPDEQPPPFQPHTQTTLAVPLKGDRGLVAIIDRADAALVSGFRWGASDAAASNTIYALTSHRYFQVSMHRLIAGAGPSEYVDHINLNGLDNRRVNLRVATPSQNHANKPKQKRRKNAAEFSSQYKGVYWDRPRSTWKAQLHTHGKNHHLGRFDTEEAAARGYDVAALEMWGEYARLNFPS